MSNYEWDLESLLENKPLDFLYQQWKENHHGFYEFLLYNITSLENSICLFWMSIRFYHVKLNVRPNSESLQIHRSHLVPICDI
jgi:hypothetical protein